MKSKHFEWVDALRGIAIFLVVLGHSIIEYPINLHENLVCFNIFARLSIVHMPVFFLVSGFCFSYCGNYLEHLKKKIKRLLIPYLAFGIIDLIPRYLFPSMVNRPASIIESIKSMLLYGGEYWFLYSLFLIMLFYPAIYKFSSRNSICSLITIVLFYILDCYFPSSVTLLTASDISQYLVFFSLGVFLRDLGEKFDLHTLSPYLLLLLFAIFSVAFEILVGSSWNVFFRSLAGVIALFFLSHLPIIIRIFKSFGNYSLQLYLLNGFFLVASRTFIVNILGITNPALIITGNMMFDFFVSYLFIKYVCARFKFVRFIMGMT